MLFLADMDAEREALQTTAYPEVQTFCQKHGLMFEVIIPCPCSLPQFPLPGKRKPGCATWAVPAGLCAQFHAFLLVLKCIMIFEQETHVFFLQQQTLQILEQVLATGQGDKSLLKRQMEG